MNIKRVGNVILTVKDMGKSVEFYNKILGMPIKRERDNWIDLGQTGALLSLRPISTSKSNVNTSTDNGILIGFVVGDVSSVIDELKLKNVKILWASTREAYNYLQAKDCGCSIITMPSTIIEKISKFGKTYQELTIDTVKKFLKENNIKLDFKESKYATGRRKKSIAKVWLKKGSGNIHVNGKKMVDYMDWNNVHYRICIF